MEEVQAVPVVVARDLGAEVVGVVTEGLKNSRKGYSSYQEDEEFSGKLQVTLRQPLQMH